MKLDSNLIDIELITTEHEKTYRSNLCNSCLYKSTLNEEDICSKCLCNLEFLHTFKFKSCPINAWSV